MTKALFYENPYQKECEAKIIEISGNNLVLDQTVFYPEGGGQPADTGFINGIKVLNVQKQGNKIIHFLENPLNLKVGEEVNCKIDWERRYKLMKLHTSAHLLVNVCEEKLGMEFETVGSGISENKARVDIFYPERVDPELKEKIQEEMNKLIKNGAEVKTWFEGEKRLVQINNFKPMPCGGTHLKNIKEINEIKIKRENIGKGKDRLECRMTTCTD